MKRVVGFILLLCGLLMSQQEVLAHPLDLIYERAQTGEWDKETYYRYLILAVYDAEELPEELKDSRPTRSMTRARMELQKNYASLSADNKALLAGFGVRGRRALSGEPVLSGQMGAMVVGSFVVYYTTAGQDAVTSAYLEDVRTVLTQVEQVEIGTWGFPRPPAGPTGPYPVYISNAETGASGIFGYMQPNAFVGDNPNSPQIEMDSYSSFLVIDNDYFGFNGENPAISLRTTLAHEYFHAVQLGMTYFDTYDPRGSQQDVYWMSEATATWMERVVFPEIDQPYRIYSGEFTKDSKMGPFYVSSSGLHEYAGFLFFEYYQNRDANAMGIFRQVMETSSVAGGQSVGPMEHYRQKVEAAGVVGDMRNLLGDYNWSLLFRTASVNGSTAKYTYSMAAGFGTIATRSGLFNLTHTYSGDGETTVGTVTVNASGGSFSEINLNQSATVSFTTGSPSTAGNELRVQWFKVDGNQDVLISIARIMVVGTMGEDKMITPSNPAEFNLSAGKYYFRVVNPKYEPIPRTSLSYTLKIKPPPPEAHPGVICVLKVTDPNVCPSSPPNIKLVASSHQLKIVWDPKGGSGLKAIDLQYEAPDFNWSGDSTCAVMTGNTWEANTYYNYDWRFEGSLKFSSPLTQATELVRCTFVNAQVTLKGEGKLTAYDPTVAYGLAGQEILVTLVGTNIEYVERDCVIPSSGFVLNSTPMVIDGAGICRVSLTLPPNLGIGSTCGLLNTNSYKVYYTRNGQQNIIYTNFNNQSEDVSAAFGSQIQLSLSINTQGGTVPLLTSSCTSIDNHLIYPTQNYKVPFSVDGFTLGDINGDKKIDVVGIDGVRNTAYGLVNLSGGDLSLLSRNTQFLGSTKGIAGDDINGDGHLDLIGTSWNNLIASYSGDGRGGFLKIWETSISSPNSVSFSDADNDGDLDFWGTTSIGNPSNIFFENHKISGFSNSYSANTQYRSEKGLWGDVNKDGWMDYVGGESIGTGINIFYGTGSTFSHSRVIGPDVALNIGLADVDNDGDLDVVGGDDTIVILKNNAGDFSETIVINNSCEYKDNGDFDSDGDIDIICFDYFGQNPEIGISTQRSGLFLYKNDGTGNFTKELIKAIRREEGAFIELADMDMDFDLDLVISDLTAGVSWIKNNSAASNSPPPRPVMADAVRNSTENTVTFSWTNGGQDDHTPDNLLTYNLRIGTFPGGDNVKSGYFNPGPGNVGNTLSWTLQDPPSGTLFYSVQAVDSAFTPGPWSGEKNTGGFVLRCKVAGTGPEIPAGPRPNLADANALASIIAGTLSATPCANRACDYNGSGSSTPDSSDLALLVSWIVGDDPEGVCLTAVRQAAGGQ